MITIDSSHQKERKATMQRQPEPLISGRLEEVSRSGLPATSWAGLRAYLGISFSKNKYFSKSRVREYILWAEKNVASLLIIIADHLEIYNTMSFQGLPFETALVKVLDKGQEMRRGYLRAVPESMRSKVDIKLASELIAQPACNRLVEMVKEVASSVPEFHEDIRSSVMQSLTSKKPIALSTAEEALRRQLLQKNLGVLQNYVFEELAIIMFVSHLSSPNFKLAIFPYPPLPAIKNVYDGDYKQRFSEITEGQPLSFIQLLDKSYRE